MMTLSITHDKDSSMECLLANANSPISSTAGGRTTSLSFTQLRKEPHPIVRTELPNVTDSRFLQSLNPHTISTEFGITTDVRLVQFINALIYIALSLSGKVTDFRLTQSLKAPPCIESSLSGNLNCSMFVHPLNAHPPMTRSESLASMFESIVHPSNAP